MIKKQKKICEKRYERAKKRKKKNPKQKVLDYSCTYGPE